MYLKGSKQKKTGKPIVTGVSSKVGALENIPQ